MNTKPPLVSIVIPLYNHEKFVLQCLDSILIDGYPNLELLILDDGSTDRSYELAANWLTRHQHNFFRCELARQQNAGITITLNRLISHAKGDFIVPIASDDYFLPGGIEARVQSLMENPKWLAVFGDCLVVDQEGDLICESGVFQFHRLPARPFALQHNKLTRMELLIRWSIPGPVFLMRSCTPAIVGRYDESLNVEDRDYYLRLAAIKALGFVNYKVACYRCHDNNLCRDNETGKSRTWSFSKASQNAARQATGMFKYCLLLDYYQRVDDNWRGERGWKLIYAILFHAMIKAGWRAAKELHEWRYRLARIIHKDTGTRERVRDTFR
jgi:glycosyltransferase involved in cell wall biosynthesis